MKIKNSLYYQPYQLLEAKNVSFADFAKNKNYYNQLSFLFEKASSRNTYTNKEVNFIVKIAKLYCNKTKPSFLDVACGTGRHDKILSKKGFDVVGIDASDALLKVARRKDKKTAYKKYDMRAFNVYRKFDCIFSFWEAYNYLSQPCDIEMFLKCCLAHLNSNGILILDSRNFWKNDVPKKRVQQRSFRIADYAVDLIMRKQTIFKDRVHEGIFIYFLTYKNGRQNIVIDQELVRIFYIKDLQRITKGRFNLVNVFGDFDPHKRYKKSNSKRMIVVFQKV